MKYRSNVEVMGQILQVANGDSNATKTKIMYQAFLSYNQLEEHLSFLIRKGFSTMTEIPEPLELQKRAYSFLRPTIY